MISEDSTHLRIYVCRFITQQQDNVYDHLSSEIGSYYRNTFYFYLRALGHLSKQFEVVNILSILVHQSEFINFLKHAINRADP